MITRKIIKNLKKNNWIIGKCEIKDNSRLVRAVIKETTRQILLKQAEQFKKESNRYKRDF